jgi:hypothetical protein
MSGSPIFRQYIRFCIRLGKSSAKAAERLVTPLFQQFAVYMENRRQQAQLIGKFNAPGVVVGISRGKQITVPTSERMKHVHVLGGTGGGKTTLLVNMAKQDLEAMTEGVPTYGVGAIDPKGDLADSILEIVPKHRHEDVILFDPSDRLKPLGFNILQGVAPELRSRMASEVVMTFKKLFGQQAWGQRLEHFLRQAVLTLIEVPGATILDIPALFLNEAYRKGVLGHVSNFAVRNFWEHEFGYHSKKGAPVGLVQPILTRMGMWAAYPEIRNIVGQEQSSINLRQVMDEKKIFIARFQHGEIGEDVTEFFGSLFITSFQFAAMSRAKMPKAYRQPFMLYVDEFQNFATESSERIITEARSFGLGFIMANQYEGQFRNQPGLQRAIDKTIYARLRAHKRQNRYFVDYTKLQEHVPPDNDPLFIECRALSPAKGSIANARYLENLSRNRFGREREAVEEDIERHAKIVYATGERSSQGNYERKGTSWDSDFYD